MIAPDAGDSWVEVSVHAQGHRGPGYDLGYDPEQHSIRGSLPNGTYTIEASAEGSAPAMGMGTVTVANGAVNAPPITMAPPTSVPINVRQDLIGAERPPMQPPPVHVTLQAADEVAGNGTGGVYYQSSGSEESLAAVKPGRYWVQVQNQVSGMYVASLSAAGKDLTRTPLVVPFGASVPTIEIVVRNDTGQISASLDGTLSQTTSLAARGTAGDMRMMRRSPGEAGPHVYCLPATGGAAPREFFPQQEGKFMLSDLPPGDYRILTFDEPQEFEYRNPEAMRTYESMGQVVHLSAGQKLQVQLKPVRSQ